MSARFRLLAGCAVWCLVSCGALSGQATAVGKFAYSGDDGPGFWSKFDARCAESSQRQSPIVIDHVREDPNLGPLDLFLPKTRFDLFNPGYTIQADARPGGFLKIDDDVYELKQFHFHTLSEHTVGARRGEMELHVVFKNSSEEYAVVGVLYRVGRPNRFLQELIDAGLPKLTDSAPVPIEELNLNRALTDTSAYYKYAGSLTTPPCSQNVTWLVLKRWAEASPEQIEAFRRILGNDFRPLQMRNNRKIRGTVGRGEAEDASVDAPDE